MTKKKSSRQGKPTMEAKTADEIAGERSADELDEDEVDSVSGGFDPQPDPPARLAQLLGSHEKTAGIGSLLPAVTPLAKKGS